MPPDTFTLAQFGAKSFAEPLAAEHSDLGYPVTHWPSVITIEGKQFKTPNPITRNGELIAADYSSDDGFIARIIND